MSNILFVMMKPPVILIDDTNAAVAAKYCGVVFGTIPPPMSNKPPAAVIPDTALVTDISGECRAGVTPHTTL